MTIWEDLDDQEDAARVKQLAKRAADAPIEDAAGIPPATMYERMRAHHEAHWVRDGSAS